MQEMVYSLALIMLASLLETSPLSNLTSNSTSISDTNTLATTSNTDIDHPKHPLVEASGCVDPNLCDVNASMDTEDLISNYKAAITKDILHRLGMEDVPEVQEGQLSEEEKRHISELYERSMKETQKTTSNGVLFNDQYSVSQFNSFVDNGTRPPHVQSLLAAHRVSSSGNRIYFPVNIHQTTDHTSSINVKAATLKLYKAYVKPELVESSDLIDRSLLIEVNQLIFNDTSGTNHSNRFFKKSLTSRRVSLESPGWEDFDVSRAVLSWVKEPRRNYGLEVVCDNRYAKDSLVGFVVWEEGRLSGRHADDIDAASKYPLLNVITQENSLEGRSRRSIDDLEFVNDPNSLHEVVTGPDDCELGDGEERCCRFPLYISFADIGWDSWVFEPRGYQAFYCSGHCPRMYKSANKYALMLSYLSGKNTDPPHNHDLHLKCVASEFKALNIAHLNRNKLPVVSILQNMVPQKCHCL